MQNKEYVLFAYVSAQKKYHEICVKADIGTGLQRILRRPAPWGSSCCFVIINIVRKEMEIWYYDRYGGAAL